VPGTRELVIPKNTPAEIIDKLNREINAALADPKLRARLADLGGTMLPGSPADFGKFIAEDTREVGQGHAGRQHQGGLKLPACGLIFHIFRSANAAGQSND
jgi:hypothetical protein